MRKTFQSLQFLRYIDQNLWECVKLADLVGLQTANDLVIPFSNYSHYCRGPVFLGHGVYGSLICIPTSYIEISRQLVNVWLSYSTLRRGIKFIASPCRSVRGSGAWVFVWFGDRYDFG